jgi:hypothetical protein
MLVRRKLQTSTALRFALFVLDVEDHLWFTKLQDLQQRRSSVPGPRDRVSKRMIIDTTPTPRRSALMQVIMDTIPGETFAESITISQGKYWELNQDGGKRKKKEKAAAKKGYSMLRMTGEDRHEFLRQAEKTIAERNRRIVDELVDA